MRRTTKSRRMRDFAPLAVTAPCCAGALGVRVRAAPRSNGRNSLRQKSDYPFNPLNPLTAVFARYPDMFALLTHKTSCHQMEHLV